MPRRRIFSYQPSLEFIGGMQALMNDSGGKFIGSGVWQRSLDRIGFILRTPYPRGYSESPINGKSNLWTRLNGIYDLDEKNVQNLSHAVAISTFHLIAGSEFLDVFMSTNISFTTENFWKHLMTLYQKLDRHGDELREDDVHFIEQKLQGRIYTFDVLEEDLVPLSHANYPDFRCSLGHEQETDFLID